MKISFADQRIRMAAILGGAGVLLGLWVFHAAAEIRVAPRPPVGAAPPPEPAARADGGPEARGLASAQVAARASGPAAAAGTVSAAPARASGAGPRVGHWDHLGYLLDIPAVEGVAGREEALRRTAAYLSIEGSRASEFLEAARQSVLEMAEALELRKRELSALPPQEASLGPGGPDERSRESYEIARAKALARLEKFLDRNPVQQEFRWGFDSWASMVAGKMQGLGR